MWRRKKKKSIEKTIDTVGLTKKQRKHLRDCADSKFCNWVQERWR